MKMSLPVTLDRGFTMVRNDHDTMSLHTRRQTLLRLLEDDVYDVTCLSKFDLQYVLQDLVDQENM